MNPSENVEFKSQESNQKKYQQIIRTKAKNVLNNYRSYTYVFTLASLKNRALEDPDSYKLNQDYFVILKSGGKKTAGIQSLDLAGNPAQNFAAKMEDTGVLKPEEVNALIKGFNAESPGRFNFYIDNVQIDTILGGGEVTSMSIATKIEFDVIETYSMTGFIEALQVSAIAAGHDSYINCPYLLKMEFFGYRDDEPDDKPEKVPFSTRYFVMGFTGLDIDVTEVGARYRCKCVPYNEKALGEAAVLKNDIKMVGTTVEQILTSFIEGVNASNKADDTTESKNYDTYEIVFPKRTNKGLDQQYLTGAYEKNKIAGANLVELLKNNAVYSFPTPEENAGESVRYDPTKPVSQFAKGADIYDCIISVVRDSEYTRNILKEFKVDDKGMIKYFMVHVETTKKGIFDKTKNKDCLHYRYIVIEYDIHYTRIQPRLAEITDTSKIKQAVLREYSYFYTGLNVDVRKFNLNFNSLFFMAIPKTMGNKPSTPPNSTGIESDNPSAAKPRAGEPNKSAMGNAPIRESTSRGQPVQNGNLNSTFPQVDPYTNLARGMHEAILENTDQCSAEIEIYGDPYYLVTDGIGNQKLELNDDGSSGDGEAAAYMGDIHILILFRNPIDIDTNTGFAFFDNRVALYSGVFRVLKLESTFKNGEFVQRLDLIRMPYQIEDTNQEPTVQPTNFIEAKPDPAKESTPTPPPPVSSVRASADNLVAQIAANLPLTGLPSALSNLIPGNLGGLSGSLPGRTSIGSLVNSVVTNVAGAANAFGALVNQNSGALVQGLSNVSSAIRLADSGLSALSTNINSAGGAVNQASNLANSVGLSKVTPENLGASLIATNASTAESVGKAAISTVNSLADKASGLVSEASAKVDAIKGKSDALAAQLGITPSSLAGLSANLQASILKQISDAAQKIPTNVDLNSAINKGLLFNNIPTVNLDKIPASQPDATAPQPLLNLQDIKNILDKGGSLANLPGAASIPGVSDLLNNSALPSLVQNTGFDEGVIADKLSTLQKNIGSLSGKSLSLEASLNNVSALVPAGVPNVSNVASSVVSQFGSKANKIASPLKNLVNSNSLG